mmetsp:Transcript_137767/g.274724  ORF Transcript_137767/g.274724 Transcript_137767/m.274724 type:complete len:418 (+) Transcript_137767:42-1295(+)|eukprot:CAMPEP_0172686718 /NCGR_PEP_ID=MMETSP1074-20121228/21134_1 /TAXON_ID=2916 /ORGANISM="Ceratium fusus, Strain PA161109" /LENGTH=417 /DNA_ID=CAMNT_0013506069 /DNA_START=41 /DNA_END=1294 /DNA_ORIENTATION=-
MAQLSEIAEEMKAAAIERVEDMLVQNGHSQCDQATIEAVRQIVLNDVDAKVQQKAEELWTRGKLILQQIQQKHKEATGNLIEEVTRCRERQQAQEAENEKLRLVIQNLTSRFAMLGQACNGMDMALPSGAEAAPAPGLEKAVTSPGCLTSVATASTAPGSSPQEGREVPETPFTPVSGDSSASRGLGEGSSGTAAKFAEVPRFPFPSQQPQSQAAPLSLAEALGTQTPQRTALSLANSLASTPLMSEAVPPVVPQGTSGSTVFTFTLRKADGADLGLNVSHHEHDRVLRVEGIRTDGAVEAWNKQCSAGGGAAAERAVLQGDHIISVNGIHYDPDRMLEECRTMQLLRLTVARGDRGTVGNALAAVSSGHDSGSNSGGATKSSALRADASVFVPTVAVETPTAEEPPKVATTTPEMV